MEKVMKPEENTNYQKLLDKIGATFIQKSRQCLEN